MTSKTQTRRLDVPPAPWTVLTDASSRPRAQRRKPATTRRVIGQFVAASLVAAVVLLVASLIVSRQAAQDEAIADARHTADVLATAVVQPALTDSLLHGDARARSQLNGIVESQIIGPSVVRVKLWNAQGRIVYSDEPRLVGSTYGLGADELAVLHSGGTEAEVSDLSRPENRFERSQGRLLEVYRAVHTPSGTPLLFETYSRYNAVTARSSDIWRRFAPITIGVLLLLQLVQLPLARRMARQIREGQQDREDLLQRAVDASEEERRRIAGALHDGVVQDMAGASFVLAGAIDKLAARSSTRGTDKTTVGALRRALLATRESIGGLRSMLVEIYPPSLQSAGLRSAIEDLLTGLSARDITVDCEIPAELEVPAEVERLIFRVAQETLRNISKHSQAKHVAIRLERTPEGVTLTIADDGIGIDARTIGDSLSRGHLGMRVMADLASAAGARLAIASSADAGTWLQLRVPLP